jgi:hypothetical protein
MASAQLQPVLSTEGPIVPRSLQRKTAGQQRHAPAVTRPAYDRSSTIRTWLPQPRSGQPAEGIAT